MTTAGPASGHTSGLRPTATPELATPRLVVPSTAHAAFAKAAHYLRVALDVVPVGDDLRADPEAMAAAIGPDTVLVAASAPSYAHGVVDPIPQLAALAAERGVRFHVDACFGGWILPYLRRLGADLPPFDLSVPGVTSARSWPDRSPAPLLEAAAALAPEMVTPELVRGLAEGLGLAAGDFSRMAGVNTLLNAAPPALREALLTGFLSLLQRPAAATE